jgi:hypothetical protein
MSQTTAAIILTGLMLVLAVHYLRQKQLLAKGWLAENAKPQIKILTINGSVLIILATIALVVAEFPYGLVGILLFIEAAVCFAFAKKLRNK